ncbi:SDR family NAD(P)-dependent oxidoreductase [Pedobacter sp.]|uniref:SDR family NAD(P)-dependent oxidoreductase n=1 Tax=Pedobacter sp. TaxID=1411316 RepID=UPI003C348EF9
MEDMQKKIVLITGATGGIGKATATALAAQGHTVVIHGRHEEKTRAVRDEIRLITGNKDVDMVTADLYLIREVYRLVGDFTSRYAKLDVLINNAGGIMGKNMEITDEGIEKTFALNLMTPFLLSRLLWGHLIAAKYARVINVSSNSHKLNAKPDMQDLQLKRHYNPLHAYGNAKLFLIWISRHFAHEASGIPGVNITVNTVDPGAVNTGFGKGRDFGMLINLLAGLAKPFFRTPEKGADTLIYLASVAQAKFNGKYIKDRRIAAVSEKHYSVEKELHVWQYCVQLAGTLIPGQKK